MTKQKTKKQPGIFYLLGAALFDYHLKSAEIIRARHPEARLSCLVTGRTYLVDQVNALKGKSNEFNRTDFLNDMVKEWIHTPVDYKKLDHYRDIFGDETLQALITADRQVGYGYVIGGYVERTPLIDFFEDNPDRRWSYIIGLLDYCFDLIRDQDLDVIYTYGVAGAPALALHKVAKHLKIPAVQLSYARMGDYYAVDPDDLMTLVEVKALYKKALKDPSLIPADIQAEADKHIDDFLAKPERPGDTVFWINMLKRENTVFGFLKMAGRDLVRWAAMRLGFIGAKGLLYQRYGSEMIKLTWMKFKGMQCEFYSKPKTLEAAVGEAKFIYFPLQVDPEMTSMVMCDKLTDQMTMIEFTAKQIPAGWKLVVKDHVPMIGRRPSYFMKRLKAMPNVCVVSPFEDNFKCMNRAELTITLTGTAGWENMILGKVPVVLGNQHYLNTGEGFVHCPEPTKIGEAIQKALKAEPISIDKIKLYTACILMKAFRLSTTYYWFKDDLPEAELSQSLNDFVDRLLAHVK